MPNPTLSDLHISYALTDISIAYSQRLNFVGRKVFPMLPVIKQANKYFLYSLQDWYRSDARHRAPGAESAGGGWRLSTDTYFADRFALHHDVSDPERANADPALANLDADATEYVTEQIELAIEKRWIAKFFGTGIWNGASSSTDMTGQAAPASTSSNFRKWSDFASTPIEDLRGEMTNIVSLTGYRPNTLVLGAKVWTALADHPDILDRIKYTERGIVSTDLLASLLDLDNVYVLWAVEDTRSEGSTSGGPGSTSLSQGGFIAGNSALLAYVQPSPGLRRPSAGYGFVWTGMTGVPAEGVRIKRFRLERNESDRIEGETWFDFKQISSQLAAFFASAV